VRFSVIEHGPSSSKSPIRESEPGPPFSHRVTGSVDGFDLDSKNQKNVCDVGEMSM
jgi:hypothetical protein